MWDTRRGIHPLKTFQNRKNKITPPEINTPATSGLLLWLNTWILVLYPLAYISVKELTLQDTLLDQFFRTRSLSKFLGKIILQSGLFQFRLL